MIQPDVRVTVETPDEERTRKAREKRKAKREFYAQQTKEIEDLRFKNERIYKIAGNMQAENKQLVAQNKKLVSENERLLRELDEDRKKHK